MVYVAVDARCVGFLALHDTVRAEAASLVGTLRRRGVDVWMLSGDAPVVAQGVAKLVGIAEHNVRGGLLPSDKEAEIRALQAKGHVVAMVGDGVNDAPALAQSDIGMAIGAGEDIAKAASDITLLGDNLESVVRALQLSDRAVRIIRQNLVWAFAYNALLIPVAMGILVPAFGVALTPLMAALAMSLSSVSVVLNSLRLRYDRPAEFLRGALLALGRLDGGYTLSTHGRRPPN